MCQPALFGALIRAQPRFEEDGMPAHFLGMAAFKWAEMLGFTLERQQPNCFSTVRRYGTRSVAFLSLDLRLPPVGVIPNGGSPRSKPATPAQ
jgi:hypothetical protein